MAGIQIPATPPVREPRTPAPISPRAKERILAVLMAHRHRLQVMDLSSGSPVSQPQGSDSEVVGQKSRKRTTTSKLFHKKSEDSRKERQCGDLKLLTHVQII